MRNRDQQLEKFFDAVASLQRTMWSRKDALLNHHPIGRSQMVVLYMASQNENGISPKEIAAHLQITSGAVTQLIDSLVADGFLERKEDSADRRIVRVRITRKAKSKFAKFRKLKLEHMKHMLDPLSDDEIVQLTNLLTKITNDQGDPHVQSEKRS